MQCEGAMVILFVTTAHTERLAEPSLILSIQQADEHALEYLFQTRCLTRKRYTPPARATSHSSDGSARNYLMSDTQLSLTTSHDKEAPNMHSPRHKYARRCVSDLKPAKPTKPHPHNQTWGPQAPKSGSPDKHTQPQGGSRHNPLTSSLEVKSTLGTHRR